MYAPKLMSPNIFISILLSLLLLLIIIELLYSLLKVESDLYQALLG